MALVQELPWCPTWLSVALVTEVNFLLYAYWWIVGALGLWGSIVNLIMANFRYTVGKLENHIMWTFFSLNAEFLASHRGFDQYIQKYVCNKLTPGQDFIFGVNLLKDFNIVKQIAGSWRGKDLVAVQLTQLFDLWESSLKMRKKRPTWGLLLESLKKDQNYNCLHMNIQTEKPTSCSSTGV